MFCSNCGEHLHDEDNFCKKCGTHTTPSAAKETEEALEITEEEIKSVDLSDEDVKKINRKATIYSILIALGFIALLVALFFGFVYYSSCSTYAPENTSFINTIRYCSENEKTAIENNFGSFNPFPSEDVIRKNNEFLSNLQSEFGEKGLLFDMRSQSPISNTYRIYTTIIPSDNSENAKALLKQYNEEILATISQAEFPNSLVNGLVLGLISPTFEGGQVAVLKSSGAIQYELPKKSAHGIAFTGSGNNAIFIFGTALGDSFKATLLHELGHLLSANFTSADWIEWAKIRNAPNDYAFSDWESSSKEDFAEEFKRYANDYKGDQSIWGNNTAWNTDHSWMFSNTNSSEASKEVQDFIKKHLSTYQAESEELDARTQKLKDEIKRLEELRDVEEKLN